MGFLKDFYSSKDTIKREKSDQKIFLIHICNKELIQRISKELVQIHKKTKGKLSEKGQKAIKTPPQGDGGSSGSQVTRKTGNSHSKAWVQGTRGLNERGRLPGGAGAAEPHGSQRRACVLTLLQTRPVST